MGKVNTFPPWGRWPFDLKYNNKKLVTTRVPMEEWWVIYLNQ